MTRAEEMAKLTKESTYNKYKNLIDNALRLIEANARQGLNYCDLKFNEFPEAGEISFRNWFIEEGFEYRNHNKNSITLVW